MEKKLIISYCGDVCSECPRFKATKTNDTTALAKIAELWHRLEFRDTVLPPENLKCNGCNKHKSCYYEINNCEHLAENGNCGLCYYFPCDKIKFSLNRSEEIKNRCKEKCSEEELKSLYRAFLMKKQILTIINNEFNSYLKEHNKEHH